MSDETRQGMSVTLKGDGSYSAPWVVFHGTGEEIFEEMSKLRADDDFLSAVVELAVGFERLYIEKAVKPAGNAGGSAAAAPAAPAAEHGFCEKCKTPLVFQSGTSQKTGKDWKAYGCPQKGYGHTKNFIN